MKKHKALVLDTNVILRYLLRDHEKMFLEANQVFESVRVGMRKAEVLDCVLAECVYVLTKYYKVPRHETADKLREILLYKGISNGNRDALINALSLYTQKNVDIVDCLVHEAAKDKGMAVFSFDHDLTRKLPGTQQ